MKTLKKMLFGVGLAAMLLLAACGGNNNAGGSGNIGSTESGGASASASSGATASANEKVTIKYWSMYSKGEPYQTVLDEIMKAYTKAHPNVTFDVQWSGRQVLTQVRNATNSGDVPDLTDQSGNEIQAALINNGLSENLNDVVEKSIPNENVPLKDVYIKGTLDQYKKDGNIYFIPYYMYSSAFFYDVNQFSKLGVTVPKTWSEFTAAADKIKAAGVEPLADDGNVGFYNAYYYYWANMRVNGPGVLLNAAGDKTGAAWDNPGFLDAAKKIAELTKKGYFAKGYQGSQYPAAQTDWAQGKAAMLLNGSWIPSETGSYAAKGFDYAAFPFPEVDGGKGNGSVESYLIGWSIPKGAKHVEATKDFIAFAMQKDMANKLVTKAASISTRKDLNAPDNLKEVKVMFENATSLHAIFDGVDAAYPEWYKTVFLTTDDKLFFGEISPEQFIQQMKQQTIDYWRGKA